MVGVCLSCSIQIKQFFGKKRVQILSLEFYAGNLAGNWRYDALFILMFLKGGETAVVCHLAAKGQKALGSEQAVER